MQITFLIKLTTLFSIIKRKFDGNEDDKKDLKDFQRKPERYYGQITQILKEKIENDKAFASDISAHNRSNTGLAC